MLNDLLDAIRVEFGERLPVSDFQMINAILVGCARGNKASNVEQIRKVNENAYAFVIGYLGDGNVPAHVSGDSQVRVGEEAPIAPIHVGSANGEVWFDKSSGETYVWYISDWVRVGRE